MGNHDDQGAGRGCGQRGRHERAARAPAPPMVAPCPAVRLSNTAAKPGCDSRRGTRSKSRSDTLRVACASELIRGNSKVWKKIKPDGHGLVEAAFPPAELSERGPEAHVG